jgi:hypothetical protein
MGTALADGGGIQVIQQRAESNFPDGVKFFIEARSPDEIDDIRVFFKKLGQSSRSSYRAVEFQPGTEVKGESFILSGSSGEYIPPGTRIEFSFEIRDQGGRVLRTDDQVFVYLDNRFQWETVSDGLITVYYYAGINNEQARAVLQTAQQTLKGMGPILGIEPDDPLHIVVYSNYTDMADALPFRAQAVQKHLITEGTAFSEERVLLVLGGQAGFLGTTSHEFTHLLVADATGRALARVPSWLNEGLAEYGNVESSQEYDLFLARAIENGQLRPLWFQGTFSGTPTEIIIGYGQGKSVVRFMVSTYGKEKMAALMDALKTTFDIDAALQEVYGFDQYGLDSQWRLSQGLEPLPLPADRVASQQPTPTSPPTMATTPAETPAVVAQPTITPVPTPTASVEDSETEDQPASPGCNAPTRQGGMALDLAVLALVGGPLAMLWAGVIRRRRIS